MKERTMDTIGTEQSRADQVGPDQVSPDQVSSEQQHREEPGAFDIVLAPGESGGMHVRGA